MNDQNIFIGIDGGGTKTEALAADIHGRILGRGTAGASNPLFAGHELSLASLRKSVDLALDALDRSLVQLCTVCVPGVQDRFTQHRIGELLALPANRISLNDDELSTFYGALGSTRGIVVSAGTGSFALGIDSAGNSATAGGWGPLIGDDGSGYAIGREALRTVTLESDYRKPNSRLADLIFEQFGIHSSSELRAAVYKTDRYQQLISGLTPLVAQAAMQNDLSAQRILDRAGADLAKLAVVVNNRIHLKPEEKLISLAGGLTHLGDLIMQPFINTLTHDLGTGISVFPMRFPPSIGALLLAYLSNGIYFTAEILSQLEVSYRQFNCPKS